MKSWCVAIGALGIAAAACGSMPAKTAAPAERGAGIAFKLGEADRLGARDCAPRALARAYVALEHVMHEADEGYYPEGWLDRRIDTAEKLADDLLAERKLVASLGRSFHCVAASPRGRAAISPGTGGAALAAPE